MKATEKHPAIDALLTSISGTDRPSAISSGACTWCKGPASEFKDALSIKEYKISGMCQKCQDSIFS